MVEVTFDLRSDPVKLSVSIPPFPKFETEVQFPPEVVEALKDGGKLACAILGIQDVTLRLIASENCTIRSTLEKEDE